MVLSYCLFTRDKLCTSEMYKKNHHLWALIKFLRIFSKIIVFFSEANSEHHLVLKQWFEGKERKWKVYVHADNTRMKKASKSSVDKMWDTSVENICSLFGCFYYRIQSTSAETPSVAPLFTLDLKFSSRKAKHVLVLIWVADKVTFQLQKHSCKVM